MRILLITDGLPPEEPGGAGRIALQDAYALRERGHEVRVLTAGSSPGPHELEGGMKAIILPRLHKRFAHYRAVFSRSRAREIEHTIATFEPDLIHAHALAWQMGYQWLRYTKKQSIPCVFTAHDAMTVAYGKVSGPPRWYAELHRASITWNPLRNTLIRQLLRHCTVLSVSDALASLLRQSGFPEVRTLHNGIDPEAWHPEPPASARAALHLPKDAPLFLLAGRVNALKGSQLINATLPPTAHLAIAGSVEPREFSRIDPQRLHVFPNQSAEQMRTLYSAVDASLVPSLYLDPFPTICLESLACGRPVLATSTGGAKEAVFHGKTGWVIDPADPEAWRTQLEWCTAHRTELAGMADRCRARARECFSLTEHTDQLEELYHTLTTSAPAEV